jgi:hypothetical protein
MVHLMPRWLVVLALVACKKGQEPATAQESGSAVQVAPADAQAGDIVAVSPDSAAAVAPVTDAGTAPVADAKRAGPPAPVDDDKLLDVEAIGPLRWGQGEGDVIKALGAPRKKPPPVEEGATGEFASSWKWADVEVEMVADKPKGPWKARLIILKAPSGPEARGPSTYATARGIKLGSSRADVAAAYPKSKEGDNDPKEFLVGSPYGGLLFRFKGDVVAEILLGPLAF